MPILVSFQVVFKELHLLVQGIQITGCMEKQEMGKWKWTRKMETDTENGNECFNILVTVHAVINHSVDCLLIIRIFELN